MRKSATQRVVSAACASSTMAACLVATLACTPAFDTSRAQRADPSTGASIYREMCNRVAVADDPSNVAGNPVCMENAQPLSSDSPRLVALYNQRQRLIDEANATLQAPVGNNVRNMLEQALPLYDNDTIQDTTAALDAWIGDMQYGDAAANHAATTKPQANQYAPAGVWSNALTVMQSMAQRDGYIAPSLTPGFMRAMMTFDGTSAMLDAGLAPITTTSAGTVQLANALSVLQPELCNAFNEPDDPNHTWFLVRDFLTTYDPALDDGTARYIVQRQTNGVAAQMNPLLQASGTPFPVGDPNRSDRRDTFGRLLDSNGNLVYRYDNVEGTVLAGLIRESARIAKTSPGSLGQLARPLGVLLGPATARSFDYSQVNGSGIPAVCNDKSVRFGGYDTTKSPLLDLVYALGLIAKKDTLAPTLEALRQMTVDNPSALAGETHALAIALQMMRQSPFKDLNLENDTAMAEDFMNIIAEVLREPGLAEDVLTALENPNVAKLGPTIAHYMTYKDRIDYDPSNLNGPPTGTMQTEVDRSQPDLRDNRSIFERFIHLCYDARHSQLCNKQGANIVVLGISYPFFSSYDACELTQIDDVAIFHAESIIGQAQVVLKDSTVAAVATSSIIEASSGIDGFGLQPTATALDRFVFAPYNNYLAHLYDPVDAWDGTPLEDRHNGTIFAWELEDFYVNVAPVLQAFYNHGRTDLFVDIEGTLHLHWGSRQSDFVQSTDPSAPMYAPNTGIVRFEPVIAQMMLANPVQGMAQSLATLRAIEVNGVDGRSWLLALARELMLPEQNVGLTTRDGHPYVGNDGTVVTQLTPMHIIVDAHRRIEAALASDPDSYDALMDGLKGTIAGLLDSDGTSFASSDTAPTAADILGYLRDRVNANAGNQAAWADGLVDNFHDVIDQPLVQTLAPLASMFMSDPAARAQVDALLIHLADNDTGVNAYTSTLQGLSAAMQLLDDEADLQPLAIALASAADPKNGMLLKGAVMMQAMANRDSGGAMAQLLSRLVTHPDSDMDSETPVEGFLDIMLGVNRSQPGAQTPRTPADYARAIDTMRAFLDDPDRGMQRLYEIIVNR